MGRQLTYRTERLTVIEQMLSRTTDGVRVVEIAKACDVDRRTIYRDLALLTQVGLPIYQKDGRFFINHDYYLATMRLNLNEAVALFLAVRALTHQAEQQNPYALSALGKLITILPQPVASHLTFIVNRNRGTAVDRGFVSVLEMITRAWSERRKVKFWYSAMTGETVSIHDFATYFIEPSSNGSLYAVGYDDGCGCIRAFKIHGVRRVKILSATYNVPDHFDPRPFLASPWGTQAGSGDDSIRVALVFSPEAYPRVREQIRRASLQFEILDERRCSLNLQVADWRGLLPWILSWGGQVEVLEPEALREALAQEAERLTSLYAATGG